MGDPAVHWHEGMLLLPQHFQAADRYWHDQVRWAVGWNLPYAWGLRRFRLDSKALEAGQFKIQQLEARLRDGTLIRVPDDGVVPSMDLRAVLARAKTADVVLAVPVLRPGRPNALLGPAEPDAEVVRYRVEPALNGVDDENDGRPSSAGSIQFRRLNLKLLVRGEGDPLSGEGDLAGYEHLLVAQVQRSGQVGALPELAPSYIPPLLACEAWAPLRETVLDEIAGRIAALVETYGTRVRGKVRFGSSNPDEVLTLEKFRILNEARTYFQVLVGAVGLHPFPVYLELCRLLGRLAILGKNLPVFDPPAYDHDALGLCFNRVKQYIDELLSRDFDQGYEQQPFVGVGLALRAPFKPAWLAPNWDMYVGVSSTVPSADCERYLTGKLNMKIAAYNRVEDVFRRGNRGLEFRYVNNQPALLPSGPEMTYFRVNRESSAAEWTYVANTLELAVRLNEDLILEPIQDKTEFTLRFSDGKPVRMTFTLFVVPPSSAQAE